MIDSIHWTLSRFGEKFGFLHRSASFLTRSANFSLSRLASLTDFSGTAHFRIDSVKLVGFDRQATAHCEPWWGNWPNNIGLWAG